MSLQSQLQSDLTAAMKARDRTRIDSLRMVIAAVKNRAVEKGLGPQGELDDEEVEKLLATEVKQREEAAEAYRDAGRDEQAAKEEAEAEVFAEYLPEQLDDDELEAIIDDVIAELDATGMQDMGPVMGKVMGTVGNRADGSRVSALVKERLTG